MSSEGLWYKNGTFYPIRSTHVNFFLQNPELLGFTQKEKEEMCVANGLPPDAKECEEHSQTRVDIMLEVLKRGAIRIRKYNNQFSVQCYDKDNKKSFRELKNCVIDGYKKVFGMMITVMDTKGWGEYLNEFGYGKSIKDFIAASTKKPVYRCVNIYSEKKEHNVVSGKMLS